MNDLTCFFLTRRCECIELERRKKMTRKRFAVEQIVTKLRQIEVLRAQGNTIAVACKEAGTTEQSYYRWRNEYGGLVVDQANG